MRKTNKEQIEIRKQKGMEIARRGMIKNTGKGGWRVPSQSGNGTYLVVSNGFEAKCNCPDFEMRRSRCKHIFAVELTITKEVDKQGNVTVTQTKRVTYPQNWEAYNAAQTNEIKLFDELLKDLVNSVEQPEQVMGRPRLELKESVFCAIQNVYSQLSQRRAHTLYRNAEGREQISHAPHFNAIGKLLNKPELTPTFSQLLTLSALPLKSVESTFAPDSSGFRTRHFNQYCAEKYGARKGHGWVKAHILVGTKTNVVVTARITQSEGVGTADSPQFAPLVSEAHNNGFGIGQVVADMGYSSRDNYEMASSIGAKAYIPFKSNATGKTRGSIIWSKMYHYFMMNRDEFMAVYHQRSNVESAFNMIKAKFGDKIRSKNWTAQQNELLCKLIAHNVVVLIHESYELGITPDFCTQSLTLAPKVALN